LAGEARDGGESVAAEDADESLLDLISGYGQEAETKGKAKGTKGEAVRSGKGKGGEK